MRRSDEFLVLVLLPCLVDGALVFLSMPFLFLRSSEYLCGSRRNKIIRDENNFVVSGM